ncbi:MAG: hypothetical protein WDN69_06400 [Aliidongia sp.]
MRVPSSLSRRLTIQTKLWLLVGLMLAALVVLVVLASSIMHQRMIGDRVDKLKAIVEDRAWRGPAGRGRGRFRQADP